MKFQKKVRLKAKEIFQAFLAQLQGGIHLGEIVKELNVSPGDVIVCIFPDEMLEKDLDRIGEVVSNSFESFPDRESFAVFIIAKSQYNDVSKLFRKVLPEFMRSAGWVRND